MRKPILLYLLAAAAVAPGFAAEPVSAFPRPSWFVQHFAAPRTKVELQAPRRLSDYVVEGKLELVQPENLAPVPGPFLWVAADRLAVLDVARLAEPQPGPA